MRALALSLALLAGCAGPHVHVTECVTCLGPVMLHDRIADEAQTQEILKVVGEAVKKLHPQGATTAPVRSGS